MRMRLDMFRSGEARGAEDRLGDADVVFLRFGVVECIDFRLLLDRTIVGDFRLGALLWVEAGTVCWAASCLAWRTGDGLGAFSAGFCAGEFPASLGDRLGEGRDESQTLSVLGKSAGAGEGDLEHRATSLGDLRSSDGEPGGKFACCGDAASGLGDLSLCAVGCCSAAAIAGSWTPLMGAGSICSEASACTGAVAADHGVVGRSPPP